MLSTLTCLAMVAASAAPVSGTQISYSGKLVEYREDAVVKSFDLLLFIAQSDENGATLYWTVAEAEAGKLPWYQQFGRVDVGPDWRRKAGTPPSFVYDYGTGKSRVEIPLPFLTSPNELKPGVAWEADGREYSVEKPDQIGGRAVWQVRGKEKFGRHRHFALQKDSPLAVSVYHHTFMNMGTEHQVQLQLVGSDTLPPAETTQRAGEFAALVKLQAALKPGTKPEWSAEQLKTLTADLPAVQKTVMSGPLLRIVRAAALDLQLQTERAGGVEALVKKYSGQAVAPFKAKPLSGDPVDFSKLKGKVVLLHFWDYRGEQLEEPYGQVGYLDFLYNKRKDKGLMLYGVAVDDRLKDEQSRGAAVRSIRKLRSFMNLSYPLLLDDGEVVAQFGDPRKVGAQLPLYVLVGADGKITHYHVGFHKVDRDRGLLELDKAVEAALSQGKGE